MIITSEIAFDRFEPWSGAVDTWNRIRDAGKLGLLEQILDDTYGDRDTMTDTDLNDLLQFDSDVVYGWLGMKTDEEIAEECREREKRRDAIFGLAATNDPDEFCSFWHSDLDMDCSACPLYNAEDCQDETALLSAHDEIQKAAKRLLKMFDEEEPAE